MPTQTPTQIQIPLNHPINPKPPKLPISRKPPKHPLTPEQIQPLRQFENPPFPAETTGIQRKPPLSSKSRQFSSARKGGPSKNASRVAGIPNGRISRGRNLFNIPAPEIPAISRETQPEESSASNRKPPRAEGVCTGT